MTMFKLIKPKEIFSAIFIAFFMLIYLIIESYPNASMVLVGIFLGIFIGGLWSDETNKWLHKNNSLISGYSYVTIDNKLYKRTYLFFLWAFFNIIFVIFLLSGVYAGFFLLLKMIVFTSEFSTIVKILLSVFFGLFISIATVFPIFAFQFLIKKSKIKFISERVNLISRLEELSAKN